MSLVYRGTSSDDVKFNVTERRVYNAPAFDVTGIEVPGRSGDILNSQERFKNKSIVYTGFIRSSDFPGDTTWERLSKGLRIIKAWVCGDAGKYHDLTDDYDPGFVRRAFVSGETAISEILDRPDGATITITFMAEPFMYEESDPIEVPETGTASGAIASFEGVAAPLQSLKFSIEPSQDLHGYSYPWPGGGGKNLCPMMPTTTHHGITFTPRDDGGYTISGTASSGNGVMDIGRDSWMLPAGTYYLSLSGTSNAQTAIFKIVGGTASQVRSGNGSFTLSEETSVFVRLLITNGTAGSGIAYVQVETGSSSTSFSPYSNICPISGWTQCDAVAAGKNLCNPNGFQNGLPATAIGSSIDTINASTRYCYSNLVDAQEGVAVSVTTTDLTKVKGVLFYGYSNGKLSYYGTADFSDSVKSKTYVFPANTYDFVRISLGSQNASTVVDSTKAVVQMERGTTVTPYTPYQGTPITIALGQTVYGGTVDALQGEGAVTFDDVDLGSLTWTYRSDVAAGLFSANLPGYKFTSDVQAICSNYKYWGISSSATTAGEKENGQFGLYWASGQSSRVIYVKDTAYTSAADFKTAMSGVKVVYELASPTTLSLTPVSVSSLLGQNNIWCNTGETEVEYVEPTENPTEWPSKPRLEITMAGAGTLTVNGKTWSIGAYTGTLICDSEIMDWYDASNLKNSLVSGDGFPELQPGENVITYTGGITKVVAKPRWRTL